MLTLNQNDKKIILDSIREIPDFPKPGINFKDITTLLNNKDAYQLLMNHLEQRYKDYNLDYIVGLDARGFIFGAALADRLKIGFVPVRKKGKLPHFTLSKKYELEYGFDEVEIHTDAFNNQKARVLMIDDLIATGGTAKAASDLIQQTNATLVEICFIMNLKVLDGEKYLKEYAPTYSVLDI